MVRAPLHFHGRLPVPEVAPLTYRDGVSQLELLYELSEYLKNILHPSLQSTVDQVVADTERLLDEANTQYVDGVEEFRRIHDRFMSDVEASLMALNDSAVSDLVDDVDSLLGGLLRRLFPLADTVENKRTIDPRDYPTVHDAIAAARSGDTVMLDRDYVLTKGFHLTQPGVTLDGAGYSLTLTARDWSVLVEAEYCTVRNLVLADDPETQVNEGQGNIIYGIRLNSDYATVENITAYNPQYNALTASQSGNHVVRNVTSYDAGWNCIGNFGNAKNNVYYDCTSIRSGRHGFSTDGGSSEDLYECEDVTFVRCLAVDTGRASLNEGKSSFHFENSHRAKLVDCMTRYTADHNPNGQIMIPGIRSVKSFDSQVDGLKVVIDSGFHGAPGGFTLIVNNKTDHLKINNLVAINNSSVELAGYLAYGQVHITNSTFRGPIQLTQAVTHNGIATFNNNLVSTPKPLIRSRWSLTMEVHNNRVEDSPFLMTGRFIGCDISNNQFIRSGDVQHRNTEASSNRGSVGNNVHHNLYDSSPVCHELSRPSPVAVPQAKMRYNVYTGDIGTIIASESSRGVLDWSEAQSYELTVNTYSETTDTVLNENLEVE